MNAPTRRKFEEKLSLRLFRLSETIANRSAKSAKKNELTKAWKKREALGLNTNRIASFIPTRSTP